MKRMMCLLLSFVMVCSMLPISAMASEMPGETTVAETIEATTETTDVTEAAGESTAAEETIPGETNSEAMIPEETLLEETIPVETIPVETIPERITLEETESVAAVPDLSQYETNMDLVRSGKCGADLYYEFYEDGVLVIFGTGEMEDYDKRWIESNAASTYIPDAPWGILSISRDDLDWSYKGIINEYSHSDLLYKDWEALNTVIIEEGVTSVSTYAFYYCTSLKTVKLPSTLEEIGQYAFYRTHENEFILSSKVTKLGDFCLEPSSYIQGTQTIAIGPEAASWYTEMLSVDNVFYYGTQEEWSDYVSDNGWSRIMGSNVYHNSVYNPNAVYQYDESTKTLTYSGTGCIQSFDLFLDAMRSKKTVIEHIVIEEGITGIGTHAFRNCTALKTVTIPKSVTDIGQYAFYGCTALSAVSYAGSYENWLLNVSVDENNDPLLAAKYSYNTTHAHSHTAEKVIPPTCTAKGYTIYACYCGDKYLGAETEPLDHLWDSGTVIKEPTATEEGETLFACTREGCTETKIEKHLHTYSASKIVDPTCTQKGYTIYVCGCGSKYLGDEVPTIPHKYVNGKCSVCGEPDNTLTGTCGMNVTWTLKNGVLTISGEGDMYGGRLFRDTSVAAQVQSVVIEEGVTSIGWDAFCDCVNMTSISISDSVTEIQSLVFSGCNSLTSVTIPSGVTEIWELAFNGCESLRSIDVDAKNSTYSSNQGVLFNKAKTKLIRMPEGYTGSYTIPYGVTEIGESSFQRCFGLTGITIPRSVTSIGKSAFWKCTGLTSIKIPDSVTSIGNGVFSECNGLTNVVIPGSVTSLGDSVFEDCKGLQSITISGSVAGIGEWAFSNCTNLTSVTIEDGVGSIGAWAFQGCTGLTSITIPGSVTLIDSRAFSYCGLTEMEFTGNAPAIQDYAFDGITATVYYPEGDATWKNVITSNYGGTITWKAKGACQHQEQTVPGKEPTCTEPGLTEGKICTICKQTLEDQQEIPATGHDYTNAKYTYNAQTRTHTVKCNNCPHIQQENCSFDDGTIIREPNGDVPGLVKYTCTKCQGTYEEETAGELASGICGDNLTWTLSNNGVLTISGTGSMYDGELFDRNDPLISQVNKVIIKDGATSIGEWAFNECKNLTSITIPDSVTSIADYAFYGCESLSDIHIPAGVDSLEYSAFFSCDNLTGIWVDENNRSYSSDEYGVLFNKSKSELIWMPEAFAGDYTIPKSVTSIGKQAFSSCGGLTDITIPDSVTSIGLGAFTFCTSLKELEIPNSVTSIGDSVFGYCSSLTSIILPRYITKIGVSMFADCTSLAGITIPNGITSIGDSAFAGCSSLTEITIPNNVTSIGKNAFCRCSGLTSMTIPGSVTSMGESVFEDCTSLKNIVIQDGVPSIDESAFQWCEGLESITIPESVTVIDDFAFYGCWNLKEITIPASVESIGYDAFGNCDSLTEITFLGNAPTIGNYAFDYVTATAYYPAGNRTWKDAITSGYGGTITWIAQGANADVTRLFGNDRYRTAIEIAEELKATWGVEKFNTIVVASGEDFPDALAGTYLASVVKAPIVLNSKAGYSFVATYIQQNLAKNGKIYLLGGTAALKESVEVRMKKITPNVVRLAGNDRYATCLEILKEAAKYQTAREVMICSGVSYTDTLVASATTNPVMLVYGGASMLNQNQKNYLSGKSHTIVGDKNTVGTKIENALGKASTANGRIAGNSCVTTSIAVAENYFWAPEAAVLASGKDYPDGLCGGVLAIAKQAPLLLVNNQDAVIADYIADYDIQTGIVVGGPNAVSRDSVTTIFGVVEPEEGN